MMKTLNQALWQVGCSDCRLFLFGAFAAVAGIPIQRILKQFKPQPPFFRYQTRSFSGRPQQMIVLTKYRGNCGEKAVEDKDDVHVSSLGALQPEHVPWYMKVERLLETPPLLSEHQRIPDLPRSSPPILRPLLEQLSIGLGLNDLSLLDLRKLDPPPALGANLLMIIATARSEKHLHVSADRLCRWLRSEHKLRPDADGLLGRYELKLKMKRKNRRAKLMGNGTVDEIADDGVRTGWVCVNIGLVESSACISKGKSGRGGFVGFGGQVDGVKIIVQMLVEKKRQELDLENLWTGITKRRYSIEAESELQSQLTVMDVGPSSPNELGNSHTSDILKYPYSNQIRTTRNLARVLSQSRTLHTLARTFSEAKNSISLFTTPVEMVHLTSHGIYGDKTFSVQGEVKALLQSDAYHAAQYLIKENCRTLAEVLDVPWQQYLLDHLKGHMENISSQQALRNLGRGFNDFSSTAFLQVVYETVSTFPSLAEWDFKIWLHCFARKLGHIGYTTQGLWQLFDQLRLSGAIISRVTYLSIVRSILRPQGDLLKTALGKLELHLIVSVLQDMHDRTGNVTTEDVFTELLECLSVLPERGNEVSDQLWNEPSFYIPTAPITTYNLPSLKLSGPRLRLNILMITLNIPIMREDSRVRLLKNFAKQQDWISFWVIWRSIARRAEARSAALYACMFQQVADSKHQKGCITVLRTWIPEMEMEWPQVDLEGDVLEAVRRCLSVADREGETNEANGREIAGEWQELRRRCREAIA